MEVCIPSTQVDKSTHTRCVMRETAFPNIDLRQDRFFVLALRSVIPSTDHRPIRPPQSPHPSAFFPPPFFRLILVILLLLSTRPNPTNVSPSSSPPLDIDVNR